MGSMWVPVTQIATKPHSFICLYEPEANECGFIAVGVTASGIHSMSCSGSPNEQRGAWSLQRLLVAGAKIRENTLGVVPDVLRKM